MWIRLNGKKQQIKQYIINKIKDRDDVNYGIVLKALNDNQDINQQCNPIPFIIVNKNDQTIMQKYQLVINQNINNLQVSEIKKYSNKHLYSISTKSNILYVFATQVQMVNYFALIRGYLTDQQFKHFTINKIDASVITKIGYNQLYSLSYNDYNNNHIHTFLILNDNQITIPTNVKSIKQLSYLGKVFTYNQLYEQFAKPWLDTMAGE